MAELVERSAKNPLPRQVTAPEAQQDVKGSPQNSPFSLYYLNTVQIMAINPDLEFATVALFLEVELNIYQEVLRPPGTRRFDNFYQVYSSKSTYDLEAWLRVQEWLKTKRREINSFFPAGTL